MVNPYTFLSHHGSHISSQQNKAWDFLPVLSTHQFLTHQAKCGVTQAAMDWSKANISTGNHGERAIKSDVDWVSSTDFPISSQNLAIFLSLHVWDPHFPSQFSQQIPMKFLFPKHFPSTFPWNSHDFPMEFPQALPFQAIFPAFSHRKFPLVPACRRRWPNCKSPNPPPSAPWLPGLRLGSHFTSWSWWLAAGTI